MDDTAVERKQSTMLKTIARELELLERTTGKSHRYILNNVTLDVFRLVLSLEDDE